MKAPITAYLLPDGCPKGEALIRIEDHYGEEKTVKVVDRDGYEFQSDVFYKHKELVDVINDTASLPNRSSAHHAAHVAKLVDHLLRIEAQLIGALYATTSDSKDAKIQKLLDETQAIVAEEERR